MDDERNTRYDDGPPNCKYETMFPEEKRYEYRISNRLVQLEDDYMIMFDVWEAQDNRMWKSIYMSTERKDAEDYLFKYRVRKQVANNFKPDNWFY